MKGLSGRNLSYMRQFAEVYSAELFPQITAERLEFMQQLVAQIDKIVFFNIPWGHNVVLMDQALSNTQRLWYAEQTIQTGWSRNVLMHQIKSDLYKRQVISEKTHNFHLTLPTPQSGYNCTFPPNTPLIIFNTFSNQANAS